MEQCGRNGFEVHKKTRLEITASTGFLVTLLLGSAVAHQHKSTVKTNRELAETLITRFDGLRTLTAVPRLIDSA